MWFYPSQQARRKTPKQTQRSSRRPQLEWLEDRVVPSIADGTILVTSGPSSFSSQDQTSFPTGIIGVNPSTAAQSPVSTGGLFSAPRGIAEALNSQQLYVADLTAFGTGAVIQIDPNTGQQNVLALGGFVNGPVALAFINGNLYVVDQGDGSGSVQNLVRIDLNTGAQNVVAGGGGFITPTGMARAPGNNVYVADQPGGIFSSQAGAIWEVSLDTGQQTLISQGGLFNHPLDVAVEPGGTLIVANTGGAANGFAGSLVRVNPQTGGQALVSSFPASTGLNKVAVGPDGTILVDAISSGTTPGRIFAVDPVTGAQKTVASDGILSLVEGVTIFRATGGGGDITASLDPATGLLRISGDAGNDAFTINQVSPGVIRISGDASGSSTATTINGVPFNDFTGGSVSGINIQLQNGKDSVKMIGVSIPGDITINAGSGSDTFTLNMITAGSINLSGTGMDTVRVLQAITTGAVSISVGFGSRFVSVTGTSSLDLTIQAISAAGNDVKFNLENDTVTDSSGGGLTLNDTGAGNDDVILSNVFVSYQLAVTLGGGFNTVSADNVTVAFGFIDGGEPNSGGNLYFDGGGNLGFFVFNFVGH